MDQLAPVGVDKSSDNQRMEQEFYASLELESVVKNLPRAPGECLDFLVDFTRNNEQYSFLYFKTVDWHCGRELAHLVKLDIPEGSTPPDEMDNIEKFTRELFRYIPPGMMLGSARTNFFVIHKGETFYAKNTYPSSDYIEFERENIWLVEV